MTTHSMTATHYDKHELAQLVVRKVKAEHTTADTAPADIRQAVNDMMSCAPSAAPVETVQLLIDYLG